MTSLPLAALFPSALALPPAALLAVLAAIAAVAALRQGLSARRRGDAGWRLGVLLLGQGVLAALLWTTLAPPSRPATAGTLVVATAATPAGIALAPGDILVALPESDLALPRVAVETVPDLATALRRHPQVRTLRVLGAGLPARDRDAARGLALTFAPAPLPAGLVELAAPQALPAGRRFVVHGRIEGGDGHTLELLDPAGTPQSRQALDAGGRFTLAAAVGPAGRVAYRLQRRDATGHVVEALDLPLQVQDGAPLRMLLLAGGVNPEYKYLRRWAVDAGFALTSEASVGGGVDIGQPVGVPSAARLAEFDLLVLDERRWRALGAGGRAELRAAVREGLGVLLRLSADPSAEERGLLQDWGFTVEAAALARELSLPGSEAPDDATTATTPENEDGAATDPDATAAAATAPAPLLSRRGLRLAASDGLPLLRDADGEALALWRAEGRGRIAVWNLGDSFRLQLGERRRAYGELWAAATGTLARARAAAPAPMPGDARVDERALACGLADGARVVAADGRVTALRIDPASGGAACAAFWPQRAGWHALHRDAGDAADDFLVRGANEAPGLARAEMRDATLALASAAPPPSTTAVAAAGSRWPWFLAWLGAAAALWWFERARAGRRGGQRAVAASSAASSGDTPGIRLQSIVSIWVAGRNRRA